MKDIAGSFETVEFWHFHVEQDQVGTMLGGARQRFFAVRCL
jgi:hypothetical protein